jgi:hypothetical protein
MCRTAVFAVAVAVDRPNLVAEQAVLRDRVELLLAAPLDKHL